MIALQHASAGKTDTSRGVSLTFSSLIVVGIVTTYVLTLFYKIVAKH